MRLSFKQLALVAAAAVALSACSADYTNHKALSDPDVNPDSNEPVNRFFFAIHEAIDTVILKPVASVYKFVMPDGGEKAVSNFVHNLGTPVYVVNSVLQGDIENAGASFWRFVVNSTWGIGGLFDVAGDAGLKARDADFGQTLAVWGVDSGPYVFIPILGPSTVRDSFGRVTDLFLNPVMYADDSWIKFAQAGITIVDRRAAMYDTIDDVYRTSVDPYAPFRSGWLQRRASEIRKANAVKFYNSKE